MNRTLAYIIIAIVVVGLGFLTLNAYIYNEKQAVAAKDEKNAEYIIDGQRVKLVNGVAEMEAAPGSASKITTRYFGNEVRSDMNGDGREDIAFLLTQQTGGSGTFFYAVAALKRGDRYIGSKAVLLGDRIAPQFRHRLVLPFRCGLGGFRLGSFSEIPRRFLRRWRRRRRPGRGKGFSAP